MSENYRILIVDDNPSIHEDIKSILSPSVSTSGKELHKLKSENSSSKTARTQRRSVSPYIIHSAYHGKEALGKVEKAKIEGNPYALILLDVKISSSIDEIETVQQILKINPETELIISMADSNYSWDQIIKKLGSRHNMLFLKKPFEIAAVKQMCLTLIDKWNTQKKNIDLEQKITQKTKELEKAVKDIQEEVSQREVAQNELEAQRSKAIYAAKMASLGEIAGGIAHEINNPLTVILTSAEIIEDLLNETPVDIKNVSSYVQKIVSMSERAGKIVKSLKSVSRQTGNDPFQDVPLQDIIDDVRDLCQQKFKEFEVDFKIDQIDPNLILPCRKTEISQVLLNLLGNSFDAIANQKEKWIQFKIEKNNKENITLSITDSGPGIPDELQEKILLPFFTTKEVGKGTGLGLSISKGLIEGHHGQLELDDKSKHTKFLITLPKRQDKS